ncbi:MAG: replication/maintenance protein RepL [Aeromonas hydrophila]
MDDNNKKNDNFVQVYREWMPEIRWLMRNNPKAAELFMVFTEHMGTDNSIICSYEVIMEFLNVSKPTVSRAIKFLKENGFIDILKVGTSSVYIINHEVAWTTDNYKKKYAKMNSSVLISHKENVDYKYRKRFERFKKLGITETNREERN